MDHVYEKHEHCELAHCNICVGGLSVCTVCHGAEGTLTHVCVGRSLTSHEQDIIYSGAIDFTVRGWEGRVFDEKRDDWRSWGPIMPAPSPESLYEAYRAFMLSEGHIMYPWAKQPTIMQDAWAAVAKVIR